MSDFFQKFFETDFMPHGHCFLWNREVLWLHVVSDLVIALAYYSIPGSLLYFVRRRRADLAFRRIFVLFSAFIFACGTTHVLGAWTIWHPIYRVDGALEAFTAAISLLTAVVLWKLMPQALALPSPAQLREANGLLEGEIAERIAAETALRQGRDELERRVRERTAELARSNEEAQRGSRAKSEFLSRMSHELRTPLNAILGFGQLLQMGKIEASDSDSVAQILKAGRHLLGLINEVLQISGLEAGRLSFTMEPVAMEDALVEACALIRPLAQARGIVLEAPEACGGAYLLADRQRLLQVLLNLLSNAVKYHRESGRVALRCRVTEGSCWRVEVTDDGPGIEESRLPELFSPFERLGAERTQVEGTGLGLALSRKIIEAMQGRIGVETALGKGSTFWVELPKVDAPSSRPVVSPGVGAAEACSEPVEPGPRCRLLYIEDNLSNRRLVEKIFANRPEVELLSAVQGRLGLELARQHQPDLVLLDLQLPDMDGDLVLQELRTDPATRHVPVVMVSADATAAQREKLLALGARAYLTKPIDVRQFLQVIEGIIGPGQSVAGG